MKIWMSVCIEYNVVGYNEFHHHDSYRLTHPYIHTFTDGSFNRVGMQILAKIYFNDFIHFILYGYDCKRMFYLFSWSEIRLQLLDEWVSGWLSSYRCMYLCMGMYHSEGLVRWCDFAADFDGMSNLGNKFHLHMYICYYFIRVFFFYW